MDPTATVTSLSATDREILRQAAYWARFLGIVGFVFSGLMMLTAVSMGSLFTWLVGMQRDLAGPGFDDLGMPHALEGIGTLYTGIFLLSAALYFVPALLLYQYATRTMQATAQGLNTATFSSALQAQRRFYKYLGVLTIIVLAFYALFIVGALVMGGLMATMGNPGM